MAKIDEYLGKRRDAEALVIQTPAWCDVIPLVHAHGALSLTDGHSTVYINRDEAEFLAKFLSDLYLPTDSTEEF